MGEAVEADFLQMKRPNSGDLDHLLVSDNPDLYTLS